MPHTNNAHGLVLGDLKQNLSDQQKDDTQGRVDTYVHSENLVQDSVVSLFDDGNQGRGGTIAAQVDLKIAASPAAHNVLGAIENFMKNDQAFVAGSVKHY
jgi:hypothetical protein